MKNNEKAVAIYTKDTGGDFFAKCSLKETKPSVYKTWTRQYTVYGSFPISHPLLTAAFAAVFFYKTEKARRMGGSHNTVTGTAVWVGLLCLLSYHRVACDMIKQTASKKIAIKNGFAYEDKSDNLERYRLVL